MKHDRTAHHPSSYVHRIALAAVVLLLVWSIVRRQAASGSSGAASETLSFEAESPENTLTGNAAARDCQPQTGCSGGKIVGGLWAGASLQFNNVNVNTAGIYVMTIHYISGDPRPIHVSVNGGPKDMFSPPKTADWNTLGVFEIEVELSAGANTILFSDEGGWAPDIDKIDLALSRSGNPGDGYGSGDIGKLGSKIREYAVRHIAIAEYEHGATFSNGIYTVAYNTKTGLAAYDWNGRRVATGVYSSVRLDTELDSNHYAEHRIRFGDLKKIADAHGQGIEVTIENRHPGKTTIRQIYRFYKDLSYFLVHQEVAGDKRLATNYMAPIVISAKGGVDLGSYGDNRVLVVPFDNDAWSRYDSRTINTYLNNDRHISAELTAIFDNTERSGLVIGSVTHDVWKTGIYWSGSDDRLNELAVFGGFTAYSSTRDTLPHGRVTGTVIRSPQIFVGYFDDYRDGLETYGLANANVAPPLAFTRGVPKGVPVGWNSWNAYGSSLNYEHVVDVSDFFRQHLQDEFHNKGDIYINLDSYWDNLTEEQLKAAVELIRRNKQKPGIYFSPFVFWGTNMDQIVEGTDGAYTYGDLVLRDGEGNILPPLDGGYALDPTHPGTKRRIDYYFRRFLDLGFEFLKIDFLTHGALEGAHYDKKGETGIQASNQAMADIVDALDGRMFISASIAPLFPSQYAHSRRISCDVDGTLGLTEYQLNNLTYGWWQNGTIYRYTDPDYMPLAKGETFEAARTRVNAAAISGTVYLNSDDVRNPTARQYMVELLKNPEINEVALKGKAFRPLEGNTGTAAADAFVLEDKKGVYYMAVFNYTWESVEKTFDARRVGLPPATRYAVTDLWTNETVTADGDALTIVLEPAKSKLLRITVR